MKFEKIVLDICLIICKPLLFMFPIKKNKLAFISLESEVLENDFKILYDELQKDEQLQIVFCLTKFQKSLGGYFRYFLVCIKQFFIINTSRIVFLDYNNYIVSKYKRKGVCVIQLWHASGAIKKFGNETNRDYKIAGYDYVICNSTYFKSSYAKAFNVKEEQVLVTGIPKQDILFQKDTCDKLRNTLREKWKLTDKKVILYAPTFRGRLMERFKTKGYLDVKSFIERLPETYVLLFHPHPLLEGQFQFDHNRIIHCTNYDLYELMCVSDILISDYSSVMFNFSILNKPMISYVSDIDSYREETGLFIDYEKEVPGPICKDEDTLVKYILNDTYDLDKVNMFQKKYVQFTDGNSTQRIMTLIQDILNT